MESQRAVLPPPSALPATEPGRRVPSRARRSAPLRRWRAISLCAIAGAAAVIGGCGGGPDHAGPPFGQRRCDPGEHPRQVVVRPPAGQPALCFGGGVGAVRIPPVLVAGFESGEYTACVGNESQSNCLDPGRTSAVGTTVTTVGSCPAGEWSGCLDRLAQGSPGGPGQASPASAASSAGSANPAGPSNATSPASPAADAGR